MEYLVAVIVLAALSLVGLRWRAVKRLRDLKREIHLPGYVCRKGHYITGSAFGWPAFGWYRVTHTGIGISPTPDLMAALRPGLVHPQISVYYCDAFTNEWAVSALHAARLSERRNLPWRIRQLFVKAYVFGSDDTIVGFIPTDDTPAIGTTRLEAVR